MRWDGARWCFLWGDPTIAASAFYAYTLVDWDSVLDYLGGWHGGLGDLSGYIALFREETKAGKIRREPSGWYQLSESYRRRLAGFARGHVVERDRKGHGFSTPKYQRPGYEGAWYDDPLYAKWWSTADLRAARGRGRREGEVVPVEQHGRVRDWRYLLIVRREEFR